jgi:hypothetical protein
MLFHDSYAAQQTVETFQRSRRSTEERAVRTSMQLYRCARWRARLRRLLFPLTARSRLLDLNDVSPAQARPSHHCLGVQSVPLRTIRGSEGRSRDFDGAFDPIQSHSRERWLSIASARCMGVPLPPVSLVQIGRTFFVRDGHHRVSVARAMGQVAIDAQVTIWCVTGPLPWQILEAGGDLACQPA